MNINQEVRLNLSAAGIPPRLSLPQGDANSRTIVATLWDGATPYNVPANAAVMVRFRKPDDTGGLYDATEAGTAVTASGNTVTAPVATQMLSVAGVVQAEIDIYGTGSGKAADRLATFRFAVEVAPSVYPDANIISSDYYNILTAKVAEAAASAAAAATSATAAATSADAVAALIADGAGAHNATYRGQNLGAAVTDAQWAAISNGTFKNMYIGDYWTIGGVTWRIAAFDYYLNSGDVACTDHHVVIVPDANLYAAKMNDIDTTEGGYTGTKMYTEGLAQAITTIEAAFGADHILEHRQFLCNAVANGKPSSSSWYDSKVELMTEQNVYGGKIFGVGNDGSIVPSLQTVDKSQFPLFLHAPSMISTRRRFCWLRDVVSATKFALVTYSGYAETGLATVEGGVRPAFAIKSIVGEV